MDAASRRRRGRRRHPRRKISLASCACACWTLLWRVNGFVPMPPPVPAQPSTSTRSRPINTCRDTSLPSQSIDTAQRTTYYDVLGVSANSDTAEIKQQYKRLARMTHPDALISNGSGANSGGSSSNISNKLPDFHEVSAAYKVLSDPKRRKKYDRELAADQFVEGTAELAEGVASTLGGFVVPFISTTAKATVKAAAKTAKVVINTSDQVQENIRKKREEEAERRRQQKLEEERLRAEINERMKRKEEERLQLEAERAERERVEAERRAEEECIAATANQTEQEQLDRIAEENRLEAERIATEAAQKAEQKEKKQQSELEKKFIQLKAEEILENEKPAQRSHTISLSSAVAVEQESDYSLDKAIQVSKDEHSGGPRSKITKPSSRRKKTLISEKGGQNGADVQEEPYDLETALRLSKEPRSFASKKSTTANKTGRSKSKTKRKKGQRKKRKR